MEAVATKTEAAATRTDSAASRTDAAAATTTVASGTGEDDAARADSTAVATWAATDGTSKHAAVRGPDGKSTDDEDGEARPRTRSARRSGSPTTRHTRTTSPRTTTDKDETHGTSLSDKVVEDDAAASGDRLRKDARADERVDSAPTATKEPSVGNESETKHGGEQAVKKAAVSRPLTRAAKRRAEAAQQRTSAAQADQVSGDGDKQLADDERPAEDVTMNEDIRALERTTATNGSGANTSDAGEVSGANTSDGKARRKQRTVTWAPSVEQYEARKTVRDGSKRRQQSKADATKKRAGRTESQNEQESVTSGAAATKREVATAPRATAANGEATASTEHDVRATTTPRATTTSSTAAAKRKATSEQEKRGGRTTGAPRGAAAKRKATTAPRDDEERQIGPIQGGDGTQAADAVQTMTRTGSGRQREPSNETKRQDTDPTLQVTDEEIVEAQTKSRLVQRLIAAGVYRSMKITRRFGLVLIETVNERRVVLPPALWAMVFKECHDSVWAGHLRAPHTYARIAQVYWWPSLQREVKRWVLGCQECGSSKARPREVVPPLRSIRGGNVGDRWALDVAGPLPATDGGQRYVIAAVEYVTRYAVARTVERHTAEKVAAFLMTEVVLRFGPSESFSLMEQQS